MQVTENLRRILISGIIDDTLALRDKYFPHAKVSVLSNSTFIHKEKVFNALNKIDNNILKLDTVDAEYIQRVDRPSGAYDVNKIVETMKAFKGKLIIQTMFMKGKQTKVRMLIIHPIVLYFPGLRLLNRLLPVR